MRYQISGKQIDIGTALQHHVKENLGHVIEKYAERPTGATIVFSRSGARFVCEATIHLSTGLTATAKGQAHEIHAAFDDTKDKLEKQLRRYKRRLKDHHRDRQNPVDSQNAPMYVLAVREETDDTDTDTPDSDTLQPMIVAELETKIPKLSVGEAVMQMELAGTIVMIFRNDKHDRLNVIYRRDDGNIGWVDPTLG